MKKLVSILLTLAMMATMMSFTFAMPDDLNDISATVSSASGLSGAVKTVLGAIQWIGYAFAIGMLIYIGIKYMMSAANEKAELKKGLINYIIGAILVAGTATICGWFVSFGDKLGGT